MGSERAQPYENFILQLKVLLELKSKLFKYFKLLFSYLENRNNKSFYVFVVIVK